MVGADDIDFTTGHPLPHCFDDEFIADGRVGFGIGAVGRQISVSQKQVGRAGFAGDFDACRPRLGNQIDRVGARHVHHMQPGVGGAGQGDRLGHTGFLDHGGAGATMAGGPVVAGGFEVGGEHGQNIFVFGVNRRRPTSFGGDLEHPIKLAGVGATEPNEFFFAPCRDGGAEGFERNNPRIGQGRQFGDIVGGSPTIQGKIDVGLGLNGTDAVY